VKYFVTGDMLSTNHVSACRQIMSLNYAHGATVCIAALSVVLIMSRTQHYLTALSQLQAASIHILFPDGSLGPYAFIANSSSR